MSRCYSCGNENVETQTIEIDGYYRSVYALCYVRIKEGQAVTRSLDSASMDNSYKEDVSSTFGSITDSLGILREWLKKDSDVLTNHANAINKHTERLKSLEERIEALAKRGSHHAK